MTVLRNNLTPFLKAVTKALSLEQEAYNVDFETLNRQKEAVVDEILQNLPSMNSTSNICTNISQALITLELELVQLKRMNLQ